MEKKEEREMYGGLLIMMLKSPGGRRSVVKMSCTRNWMGAVASMPTRSSLTFCFFRYWRSLWPLRRDPLLWPLLRGRAGRCPLLMLKAKFSSASATAFGEMSRPRVLMFGNLLLLERRE